MKGSVTSLGSINHHITLVNKMRAMYRNKKSFKELGNMEIWINSRLRRKHGWQQVEQNRLENKRGKADEDDAEDWQDEPEDDGDY